ncbi:cysteine desulfurase, putative [Plasmodium gallinaceum]|uniref:cysteine desulfurase n=1 Tax=Plasmodium gallinaceum TaxID=5849 RepID=A0A1J1GPQ3_PLAGA|nr:cysteine desulfurase, putative [Plasmodium gallinaceum]CRG93271.1 cysteine desulfurase, putative [Plasmodium gallinaceum]
MRVFHVLKNFNILRNSIVKSCKNEKTVKFKKVLINNLCSVKKNNEFTENLNENNFNNKIINKELNNNNETKITNDGHIELVDTNLNVDIKNTLNKDNEFIEKNEIFDDIGEKQKSKINRFYLDSQATTMIDPRVLDKMLPYLTYIYGNAHSRNHFFGWESEKAVEDSRKNIIDLINGKNNKEIIFTSGATESNNLALIGICTYYNKLNNKKNHIITSQIEHKCILQTCRYLQTKGFEITYLKPDEKGIIKLEDIKNNIKDNTIMASFIYVNNEIGVIQDIENIGKLCKEKNIIFHTDASQAVGKIPIDAQKMNIDLMSISAHKIYGPKGIGALYIKRKKPNIRLNALIHGGGQERGLRSGTLPTHLIVGFGEAANICIKEMDRDNRKMRFFFNYVKDYLSKHLDYIVFNGCQINRYFGNVNISFLFVEGESLLMSLNDIALSSGSACTSSTLEPSYVLRSIGVSEDIAHTSIRIGFNRFTTFFEVKQLCINLVKAVKRLRSISPLYEMELEKKSSNETPQFIWT